MLLLTFVVFQFIFADTDIYVGKSGRDEGNCSTQATACATLSYAYSTVGDAPVVNVHILSTGLLIVLVLIRFS
jgi:hypothetical protein